MREGGAPADTMVWEDFCQVPWRSDWLSALMGSEGFQRPDTAEVSTPWRDDMALGPSFSARASFLPSSIGGDIPLFCLQTVSSC